MSDGSPLRGYRKQLTYFKETDAERNELIKELIEKLEIAQTEGQKTLLDLVNEQESRRRLQDAATLLEKPVRVQDAQPFVLVLIDADADDYIVSPAYCSRSTPNQSSSYILNTQFHESFLNKGEDGGKGAAEELNDRVIAYLQNLSTDFNGVKVMIKAYADVKNLQKACLSNGKMRKGASLDHFVIGFNQRQALFDFVDVGNWKEGADNKIRECLDFYIASSQCKHIIFGACHDSGYAPYLGKHAADASANDRITLLKGSVIHPRIAKLGFNRTIRFKTVFAPKVASPPVSQLSVASSSAVPVRPRSTPTATEGWFDPSSPAERLGPVLYNEAGQRVDKLLNIKVQSPYLDVLRHNKLCHYYYLRGECKKSCDKNHAAARLDASSFDHLWYLSRGGQCFKVRNSKRCDDPKCVYGHETGNPIGSGRV